MKKQFLSLPRRGIFAAAAANPFFRGGSLRMPNDVRVELLLLSFSLILSLSRIRFASNGAWWQLLRLLRRDEIAENHVCVIFDLRAYRYAYVTPRF